VNTPIYTRLVLWTQEHPWETSWTTISFSSKKASQPLPWTMELHRL